MSQLYVSIAITALPLGVDRLPLMTEVLSRPLWITPTATLQKQLWEHTWITQEGTSRFQINHASLAHYNLYESHEGWHKAYEELMHLFVQAARPLLWVGNWDANRFSYHELLRPLRGERVHYPPGHPMRGDEHESTSDLRLASGLEPEEAARLTTEELDFVIQCRRLPLRALAEHRLVDIAGWVVYLGPELVATYGEEKLLSIQGSDIWQDERGGVFLYLRSSVTTEVYRPRVTTSNSVSVLPHARKVLGIDTSWFLRYNELEAKARGLPWSRETFHF